jgi:hypothetical protein
LLNPDYSYHQNAVDYYRYFLQNEFPMICSTISIAEYCVAGALEDLPLKNIQILPFNLNHASRTGELAGIAFEARRNKALEIKERLIIPNDTKLFSQADVESNIKYYLSSDLESKKIYDVLYQTNHLNFRFLELNTRYQEAFGLLDL